MDTYPPGGGLPASDPAYVAVDHLDRHGIDYAVLSQGSLLGLSGMHDLDRAAELAVAINDWTIDDWFPVDERYLGSVTVATSDPLQAAAEIRRVGTNPRMDQFFSGRRLPFPRKCAWSIPYHHQSSLTARTASPDKHNSTIIVNTIHNLLLLLPLYFSFSGITSACPSRMPTANFPSWRCPGAS